MPQFTEMLRPALWGDYPDGAAVVLGKGSRRLASRLAAGCDTVAHDTAAVGVAAITTDDQRHELAEVRLQRLRRAFGSAS